MISYNKLLENFKYLLKENGLKFTSQRELILKFLYEHDEHFTPEEINDRLKHIYPNITIGIATIYRTLTLLEDAGVITSISFGAQGKRYELGLKKHHDHLVCIKCGKIFEFFDEIIEERQKVIAQKFQFKMTDHSMKLIGICSECQKSES
ncbi:MAG TPA: transcriptional repressor [Epsilonproteobacteria bacterium]|nr:transcriptional repressor [Campylobacterota bacterium]